MNSILSFFGSFFLAWTVYITTLDLKIQHCRIINSGSQGKFFKKYLFFNPLSISKEIDFKIRKWRCERSSIVKIPLVRFQGVFEQCLYLRIWGMIRVIFLKWLSKAANYLSKSFNVYFIISSRIRFKFFSIWVFWSALYWVFQAHS